MGRTRLDKKDAGASSKMKTLFLYAIFGGALFLALNNSLYKMTAIDCNNGIEAACAEIRK